MNILFSMNLLWIILALTQRWYYVLPVYLFFNTADSITVYFVDIAHSICELPMTHTTFVCRTIRSIEHNASPYTAAVTSGFSSLKELAIDAVDSSITALPKDYRIMSVDDTVFLVKSNRMECHEKLVEELDRLKEEFVEISDSLMELRAQSYGAIVLCVHSNGLFHLNRTDKPCHSSVISASDHLLDLLSGEQLSTFSLRSITCFIAEHLRLPACHTSPRNILLSFQFTIQELESAIDALSSLADALDDGLDRLEQHLKTIRDLASDEL
jgi:hypothetical protein